MLCFLSFQIAMAGLKNAAVTLLFSIFVIANASQSNWKQNIKYFEKASLNCSENDQTQSNHVQFWILPSGEMIKPGSDKIQPNIHLKDNGFVLEIDKVDDADFGLYFCIIGTGVNGTGLVKKGVNVDGPYYGEEYYDSIRRSATIGGIAGGCTLVLLIALWVMCARCKRKPLPLVDDECDNKLDSADSDKVSSKETILSDKSDDNIYYIADGIKMESNPPTPRKQHLVSDDTSAIVSTSESVHYHSIGSLGRDAQSPTSEPKAMEPGEIYAKYLDDLHNRAKEVEVTVVIDERFESDENPYATVAKKPKQQAYKEPVQVINGDVVIETTGDTVTVTSTVLPSRTNSEPKVVESTNVEELADVFEPIDGENADVKL